MITSVSAANEAGKITITTDRDSVGKMHFFVTMIDKNTNARMEKIFSPQMLALFMETIQSLTPRG